MSKPHRIMKGRLKAKKIVDIRRAQRDPYNQYDRWSIEEMPVEDEIRSLEKNRKRCSCAMCGNQRHSARAGEQLTKQEVKAKDNFKDQLNDV